MPSMRDSWDDRIQRAEALSAAGGPAEAMLTFYGYLLRIQKDIYESLGSRRLTGEIAADATPAMQFAPRVLTMTISKGPAALREQAEERRSHAAFEEIAQPFLHRPSDRVFFGNVLVQ